MTATAIRTDVDAKTIDELAAEDQRRTRLLESEMAWDRGLAHEMHKRWPRLASGSPLPLPLLHWPDAPPVVRQCLEFWRRLPRAVDAAIGGRWPAGSDVDDAVEARLVLLALRCAGDNELRARWIAHDPEPRDARATALVRDHVEWVRSGTQLYGTLSTLARGGGRLRVPIQDEVEVDRRRLALRMPALADDLAAGMTELQLVACFARRAGFM